MSDTQTIRSAFERNAEAIQRRPSIAKSTGTTRVRVLEGTTCEVTAAHWTFLADVGKEAGGNDKGPGPGIFERAALGSCLAIGYVTQAAVLDVPIDGLEVVVESDFDARAMHGIDDKPPGFEAIRYRVIVESPASEADVRRVLDTADALSPVRDDFARAIPVERELEVKTTTNS